MHRAADGLDKIVQYSLRKVPEPDVPLLAWPLVCGSAVAERTRAVSFSNSILQVEVTDVRWKRELESLCAGYLVSLNRYSKTTVRRIEFVIRAA